MLNGVPYLQASIEFAFYVAAMVCFVVAAVLPRDLGRRWGGFNVMALGLALALAPTLYIYFKVAFHKAPVFH